MGASHLVKEDGEWLTLYMYVHNDPDELPDWYDVTKHSYDLLQWTESIAYEVRIDYRVNKTTYKVEILNVSGLS
jgi:hypothetical protein